MNDFTYRSQQVDYLGFLEAQLRDLQGVDRLAYEMIQNADDAPAGDVEPGAAGGQIIFDVTAEALIIENDSVFRPADFQRLQHLAGGAKRHEADTTGAFGIGFISVYQLTDAPQIFSGDRHWTIRPDAPPERRIQERRVPTGATRFVLPWSFAPPSAVRRALRIEAVDPQKLDAIASDLAAAIGTAALFLKRLTTLEVRRNGAPLRSLRRSLHDDHLVLTEADGEAATWLLLSGNFEQEAARLRRQFHWQIEDKRQATVTIAVPTGPLPTIGRLFAVLPTDSTMPLPIAVDADFFPTTDRRRIHLDGGYQARWNEQALACAAGIFAASLDRLSQSLQPSALWRLLQRTLDMAQAVERGELAPQFTAFWQSLAPHLAGQAIAYSTAGHWLPPTAVRIVEREAAHPLLQDLGLSPVHRHLAPYYDLMRLPEIGVAGLSLADLSRALQQDGLQPGHHLAQARPPLNALDAWQTVWQLIDDLLAPVPAHQRREQALAALGDTPLALDETWHLRSLRRLFRAGDETRALFPDVCWLHPRLSAAGFPAYLVVHFGVRQAVDHLAALTPEQLQEAWQMGRLDLPALFRWLEAHQIEIFADALALRREILNLPLAPISGQLQPLAHLFIPGGFEDPLKLTAVVDIEAIGGRRQFLEDLGLQPLEFETYVRRQLPQVLARDPDLPSDARHRLLQLLAQRLGQIRDDAGLRQGLSLLPLVACMDGSFRSAREVYATREAAALLGAQARVAEPPPSQAIAALYDWLGVRHEPAAADLVQAVLHIAQLQLAEREPLDDPALKVLADCWLRLDALFGADRLPPAQLARLRTQRSLPNRRRTMRQPGDLFYSAQAEDIARFNAAAEDLNGALLHEATAYTPLVAAAGVRPLAAAIQQDIAGDGPASPAADIEQRVAERLSLIARLLHENRRAEIEHDPFLPLRTVRFQRLASLRLQPTLKLDGHTFRAEPLHPVAAYSSRDHTIYFDARQQPPPWPAIARELGGLISPAMPSAGLALGIREVLSAAAYEDAAAILDELGYP